MGQYKHKPTKSYAGIPRHIINSDAFKSLKGNEAKLLLLMAHFFTGKNNGDISLAMSIMKQWFKSNTTLLRAKNVLHKKGFIVINAYGGLGPNRNKLPSLYAITWQPINKLTNTNNKDRVVHYLINGLALNYWEQGSNPDIKTTEEKKKQFVTDFSALN